jgi:hypothetical protein
MCIHRVFSVKIRGDTGCLRQRKTSIEDFEEDGRNGGAKGALRPSLDLKTDKSNGYYTGDDVYTGQLSLTNLST